MGDEEIVLEDDSEELTAKLKKLREKLEQCQIERQEYLTASQRFKADYLNLRRETEEGRTTLVKFANEVLLGELLAVADGFEQALASPDWVTAPEAWRRGLEQVYAQLQSIFGRQGLVEINPVGEKFDPALHQAVGVIARNPDQDAKMVSAGEEVVREVMQKGYKLNERVIRPARVKISQ